MISVITRQFGSIDNAEVTNISIEINSYRISIGIAKSHYCKPRTFQGLNPERERVEVCVLDQDGEYATKEIFKNVLEEEIHDDVAAFVTTNDLIRILTYIEELYPCV